MTVEGIAYRRRAKASTVGSDRRVSAFAAFCAICRLIDGGSGETRGVPACSGWGVW